MKYRLLSVVVGETSMESAPSVSQQVIEFETREEADAVATMFSNPSANVQTNSVPFVHQAHRTAFIACNGYAHISMLRLYV